MPTTPLTIRPPKSCFHAYYALVPAIHTARTMAVLIWAGSPSTTKWKKIDIFHVNLAKTSFSHINFIQFRLSDCLHRFLSEFPSLTSATRFAISIILSMQYLPCARLAKSIADNLFSYINFIQFRHSDCLHQNSHS